MTDVPAVRIVPAGDAALLAEFEDRIDVAVNARAIAMADILRLSPLAGIRDIVPTYRSVAVYFDPLATDVDRLVTQMREAATAPVGSTAVNGVLVEVPVCYDAEFGPDLDDVAHFAGLGRSAVVAAHAGRDYRVFMLGFVPGFAYLGIVDSRIAAPRRAVPRARVPIGSVGIAGEQTGIYPSQTPGGWNLVGRTPLPMVSLDRAKPSLLEAGDTVRFRAIDRGGFNRIAAAQRPGS
jgi:inhibitor of KinA